MTNPRCEPESLIPHHLRVSTESRWPSSSRPSGSLYMLQLTSFLHQPSRQTHFFPWHGKLRHRRRSIATKMLPGPKKTHHLIFETGKGGRAGDGLRESGSRCASMSMWRFIMEVMLRWRRNENYEGRLLLSTAR